jgi:hypothetical protein
MVVSGWQLNRFERILFRLAILVAALLIVVRLGAIFIIPYLHHSH